MSYIGYWRVGGDRTFGGTTSNYVDGTIDEVAVYATALPADAVERHFAASGRQLPEQAADSRVHAHRVLSRRCRRRRLVDGHRRPGRLVRLELRRRRDRHRCDHRPTRTPQPAPTP